MNTAFNSTMYPVFLILQDYFDINHFDNMVLVKQECQRKCITGHGVHIEKGFYVPFWH
jgi:hypothetical protein